MSAPATTPRINRTWRLRALALLILAALTLGDRDNNPNSEVLGRRLTRPPATGSVGDGQGSAGVPPAPDTPFTITGNVDGLAPGVDRPLALTISNDQNVDIIVQTVTVTIGSPGGGCDASDAAASSFEGTLPVRANSTATLTLSIRLDPDATNACQGKSFPLAFEGTGVPQ